MSQHSKSVLRAVLLEAIAEHWELTQSLNAGKAFVVGIEVVVGVVVVTFAVVTIVVIWVVVGAEAAEFVEPEVVSFVSFVAE